MFIQSTRGADTTALVRLPIARLPQTPASAFVVSARRYGAYDLHVKHQEQAGANRDEKLREHPIVSKDAPLRAQGLNQAGS